MKTISDIFKSYPHQKNHRQQAEAHRYGGRAIAVAINSGSGTGTRMDSVSEILVKLTDGSFRLFHFRFFDTDKDGRRNPLEVKEVDRTYAVYFCRTAYDLFNQAGNSVWKPTAADIEATVDA